ncbi:isochorismatase family protein [Botrimarina hoheduenensis]|uniref:Putative hydrolase n=1 Tax=Botrimarina hoheduenensis TaxID=2528000 RepID=A0A5C5VW01_9BACT|nr:isochorismatase family protein [Botrimarina hoheduenensis]TWT42764.1 putative hydrolase [Botrimarina hoheduenensis]
MAAPLLRSPDLMNRNDTVLLVIDVQERLLAVQPEAGRIIWNCRRLLDAAQPLGVTVAARVQAPEKLGPLATPLAERCPEPIGKTSFSAADITLQLDAWRDAGVRHVLLVGIETHVCIAQTAIDLISRGFDAKVAVDAVGSRHEEDHTVALRRMESSGVMLTTTEAVLFEWCVNAQDPAFRSISALAKETLDT